MLVMLLAVGLTLASLLLSSGSGAAAPAAPSVLTSGFQDHRSGAYFRVQLDETKSDYGAFVIAIPGHGLVWGSHAASIVVHEDEAIVRYDGAATVARQAHLDTEFGVNFQPIGAQEEEQIHLRGHLQTNRATGRIDVSFGQRAHEHDEEAPRGDAGHITIDADSAQRSADAAVGAYLHDIVTGDWAAMYGLTDSSLRGSVNEVQFAQTLTQDMANFGKVVAARLSGRIAYSVSAAGVSYAEVPVDLTRQTDQGPVDSPGQVAFVFDAGAWRILTVS